MNSVKNLTFDMLKNLSEDDKRDIRLLGTLEDVVLDARKRHALALYPLIDDGSRAEPKSDFGGKKYFAPKPQEEITNRVYPKLIQELERLDMLRKDLDSLRLSANIFAFREAVNNASALAINPGLYFDSSKFMPRMIVRLSNESYENWPGFTMEDVQRIMDLLKGVATLASYDAVRLCFGLDSTEGKCATEEGLKRYFGCESVDSVYQMVQRTCETARKHFYISAELKNLVIPTTF